MVCHDDAGEILVATGLSFYPNLDRAEAYAIVNHRGIHRSVRAFRRLGADRIDLRLGPIAPVVLGACAAGGSCSSPTSGASASSSTSATRPARSSGSRRCRLDRGYPPGRRTT